MTWTLAVDGRALGEGTGGFKRYAENLLPAMAACDADLKIHLLTHQPLAEQWCNAPFSMQVIPGTLSLPARLLWESLLHRHIPDTASAFFSPMGLVPKTHLPKAITVHDTAFRTHPQLLPRRYRWYWQHIARRWHSSELILVPSESTRDALSELGVSADRIVVTKEGVAHNLQRPALPDAGIPPGLAPLESCLQGEFVLFVGTIEPRKDLGTLITAMSHLNRRPRPPLILAGRRGWGRLPKGLTRQPPRRELLSAARNAVLELGAVSDDELAYLYSRAAILALPSWTEGFGLPALEALSAGLPVIASNCGALPEILRDAGVLIPPGDPSLWTREIDALLSNSVLRQKYSELGARRAAHFSWKATAQATLAALQRLRY